MVLCQNSRQRGSKCSSLLVEKLGKVIDIATQVGRFDESVLFRGENANVRLVVLDERGRQDAHRLLYRFSRRSSKITSAMSRASWTALAAIVVGFGARSRRPELALL